MKGAARFDKDSALLAPLPICTGEVAVKTQVALVKRLNLLQLEFNGRLAGNTSNEISSGKAEALRQTEGIWSKKQDSDGTESLREAVFGTKSRGKSVSNQLQQQPRRFVQNCHGELGQICIGPLSTSNVDLVTMKSNESTYVFVSIH
ncbi:Polypeptide N-acetylgalactosaminyltransferase [Trichinella spiralis]|uniref:Polypeptide N-acetylgalactosaminyltransferase n=2 Tax=Trichinella spiralis TaxID=6334 RepID=A0ABR3KV68_TRISP|nr:hypothetical protein T01_12152 [Trichinella spiralis]